MGSQGPEITGIAQHFYHLWTNLEVGTVILCDSLLDGEFAPHDVLDYILLTSALVISGIVAQAHDDIAS